MKFIRIFPIAFLVIIVCTSFAVPFSEGLAFAAAKDWNRSGYIEKNGKFKFTFDFSPTLIPGDFKEGLAPVGKDKKWGFIDNTGSFIILPKYEDAFSFSQGVAAVKKNGKWGLINHAGEVVLEPKYEWIFPFHDGLALVHGEHGGFINPKGELVIDFHALGISEYGEFSEGYASVTKDGKRGVIDSQGQFVIPPTYIYISEFHEGLAAVSADDKYGFIDTTGKLIIPMQYDLTYSFRNGQALVNKDGKWSFINVKGELVGLTSYDTVDSVMGTSILSPIYPPFSDKANGMAMLHKGDQTFYVLPNGRVVQIVGTSVY